MVGMAGVKHLLLAFLRALLFGVVAYLCDLKAICLCPYRTEAEALSPEARTEASGGAWKGPTLGDALGEQILSFKESYFYQIISNVLLS